MKWKKYSLDTITEAVDIISATLGEIGIEGIEIEDNIPLTEAETKGMFIDILPELPIDQGKAKISFYLEAGKEHTQILVEIKRELEELRKYLDIGEAVITSTETEDKDWINNWKEFFKPFMVGGILIKPTWEEIPPNAQYHTLIQIDPGTAFGTGAHETTQLCIKQLEKYIDKENKNIQVLDVGTGSGILGISALKLGAKYICGTDLDEMALEVVQANKKSNGIIDKEFETICGNILDDTRVQTKVGLEKYDIIVANILAPVIIELQKKIANHLKNEGIFIMSGIIDDKEESVKKALKENPVWEILETNVQGEWVSITARKVNHKNQ